MIAGLLRWAQVYFNNTQIYPNTDMPGLYLADSFDGLDSPPQRVSSSDATNQDGGFLNNALYSGRNITFGGQIYSSSASQYEQVRRDLGRLATINHDSSNKVILPRLELTTISGNEYYIDGQPRIQMPWTKNSLAQWQIFLYCPDPIIYSKAENTSTATGVATGSGFAIPFSIPFSLGSSSGGAVSVINQGNAAIWPEFRLSGVFTNPRISVTGASGAISLNYTMASDDTVIISTNPLNRTVIRNGNVNMFSYLVERSWFQLPPGEVLQIAISSSDNADTGTLEVIWHDGFITI